MKTKWIIIALIALVMGSVPLTLQAQNKGSTLGTYWDTFKTKISGSQTTKPVLNPTKPTPADTSRSLTPVPPPTDAVPLMPCGNLSADYGDGEYDVFIETVSIFEGHGFMMLSGRAFYDEPTIPADKAFMVSVDYGNRRRTYCGPSYFSTDGISPTLFWIIFIPEIDYQEFDREDYGERSDIFGGGLKATIDPNHYINDPDRTNNVFECTSLSSSVPPQPTHTRTGYRGPCRFSTL